MKKKDRKNKKSRFSPLAKIAMALAFLAICGGISLLPAFEVKNYEVEGNSYYSDDEILVMGDCKTGGNIFWDVDAKDIKERLSKDSYMSKVRVQRKLPGTVKIKVTERKQKAALVFGSSYVVIDEENIVLRKTSVAPQLPLIQGVTISQMDMGTVIEVKEKVRFQQANELIQIMEDNDMYFKKIVMEKAQVKAYVLDNLVCVGSATDLMDSVKDGNVQKVVRQLFKKKIERGTIKVSGGDYISFSPEIA